MSNKKTTTTILNNDMKSHDKISYICHSKYATLRVLMKDHYQYSNLRSDHIF